MWVLDPVNSPELISALRPHARDADFDVCWVGEGWRDIVADCHRSIISAFPDYELLAVKQKYGVLEYQAFPRPWTRDKPQWTIEAPQVLCRRYTGCGSRLRAS